MTQVNLAEIQSTMPPTLKSRIEVVHFVNDLDLLDFIYGARGINADEIQPYINDADDGEIIKIDAKNISSFTTCMSDEKRADIMDTLRSANEGIGRFELEDAIYLAVFDGHLPAGFYAVEVVI